MFSGMTRSPVTLLRRASGSAAIFGAGYGFCWAQGREESGPQLVVWATAASWVRLTRCLRLLGQKLPEGAEWPLAQLRKVEATELRFLDRLLESSREQGLESMLLQRLVLESLCEQAQADVRGPAVQGLFTVVDTVESDCPVCLNRSSLAELAVRIDAAATGAILPSAGKSLLDDGGEKASLLLPLTSALEAVTRAADSWAKELGPEGVICVARSATTAAAWLAAARSSNRSSEARLKLGQEHAVQPVLLPEDEAAVTAGLCAVWQALASPPAAASLSPSRRASDREAADLRRGLDTRLAALEAAAPADVLADQLRPAKDFLPAKLKACMANCMSGKAVSSSRKASNSDHDSGVMFQVGRILEGVAWAALIGVAVAAASEDGFGLLRFHAVPEAWRSAVHSLLQQRAVRVEELLAKYDPPPEPNGLPSDAITLGPWEAQAGFIQAPMRG
ncbi:unnamed protein product [Polarella glacialis]|uniref:Uncharacterized protein n=1 Tax=Polarella glacialis TaxID=89957 RepID=A0A813IC15_POLGL|nr:unnamed protein product [Polarella glacialis]